MPLKFIGVQQIEVMAWHVSFQFLEGKWARFW
jgi:hypothetical protein